MQAIQIAFTLLFLGELVVRVLAGDVGENQGHTGKATHITHISRCIMWIFDIFVNVYNPPGNEKTYPTKFAKFGKSLTKKNANRDGIR